VAAKLFPSMLSTGFSLQTIIIPVCPLQWLCIFCNSAIILESKDYSYFIHLQRSSRDVAVSKYFLFSFLFQQVGSENHNTEKGGWEKVQSHFNVFIYSHMRLW